MWHLSPLKIFRPTTFKTNNLLLFTHFFLLFPLLFLPYFLLSFPPCFCVILYLSLVTIVFSLMQSYTHISSSSTVSIYSLYILTPHKSVCNNLLFLCLPLVQLFAMLEIKSTPPPLLSEGEPSSLVW